MNIAVKQTLPLAKWRFEDNAALPRAVAEPPPIPETVLDELCRYRQDMACAQWDDDQRPDDDGELVAAFGSQAVFGVGR